MRTSLFLLVCVILLPICALGADADESQEGISLGIHCGGSEWDHATPMLRWRSGPTVAVDFTASYSYWGAGPHQYGYDLHFELGYVRTVCVRGPLVLALRVAPGYMRNTYSTGSHEDDRETTYGVDVAAGPDLEYFLPSLPQLSIGIQSVIRVRFREEHQWGDYDGYTTVDMLGQWLAIRYYF